MFHCPCCFHFGVPYGNDNIDDLCSLFVLELPRKEANVYKSRDNGRDERRYSVRHVGQERE